MLKKIKDKNKNHFAYHLQYISLQFYFILFFISFFKSTEFVKEMHNRWMVK